VGILIDTSIISAAERGGQLPNVAFGDEFGISSITLVPQNRVILPKESLSTLRRTYHNTGGGR
jgi:hypothetical protein